jgi:hypothetical protein
MVTGIILGVFIGAMFMGAIVGNPYAKGREDGYEIGREHGYEVGMNNGIKQGREIEREKNVNEILESARKEFECLTGGRI